MDLYIDLIEIVLPVMLFPLVIFMIVGLVEAVREFRRKAAIQRGIEDKVKRIISEEGKAAAYDYLMSLPPEYPPAPEKRKRDVYYLEDDEWGEESNDGKA